MTEDNFRVGAIHTFKDKTIEFFGYGVYLGDEIPPSDITFLGMSIKDPTPKLQMDSGDIIWGCECWWGDVEHIDRELEGKKIIEVNINDIRSKQ